MKCIVRIPMARWAVKFFLKENRHNLEDDLITVRQTAKDKIGKIITGYMRKTMFDTWYMGVPDDSHLRVALAGNYAKHGLTKKDLEVLQGVLEEMARDKIVFMVAVFASLPGVSRSQSIRKVLEGCGITEEEYDQSHFRRYFDRYCADSLGVSFKDFRAEVTRALKEIFGEVFWDLFIDILNDPEVSREKKENFLSRLADHPNFIQITNMVNAVPQVA